VTAFNKRDRDEIKDHDRSTMNATPFLSRRKFFTWVTGFIMGFIGLALSIPLVGYIVSPAFHRRIKDWVEVGDLTELTPREPKQLSFVVTQQDGWIKEASVKTVWAVQGINERVVVYSPLCPHLGCGYHWNDSEQKFICPCHISVFDIEGNVLSGPAPRPLDRLPIKEERGRLHVIYKEFKSGTPKQIEL
jgi:menaquinol-cytochrome c reductase iron-sulfur subunit